MKYPIEIGSVLYASENRLNLSYQDDKIIELRVTRIGRKYFYAKTRYSREKKFDLETFLEAESDNYKLRAFPSKEAILEQRELHGNIDKIRNYFRNLYNYPKNLTLEKTRQILEIIKED